MLWNTPTCSVSSANELVTAAHTCTPPIAILRRPQVENNNSFKTSLMH